MSRNCKLYVIPWKICEKLIQHNTIVGKPHITAQ